MKIAVMTDSTSYLPQTFIDKHHIKIVSLSVTFDNGDNYIENETIFADEFYARMETSKTIPTTSQPAIGEMIETYEQLRDEGYTDVIAIFLSSGISGCYQTATQAGKMVDGINIHTFDSEISAMAEGSYVYKAVELVQEGQSPEQIIDALTEMRKVTGAFLMVDDLKNLQKSGRITGAQALIGSILKMKPVLTFTDGKIVPEEKIRTKKRALKVIEEKVLEAVKDAEDVTLLVISGDVKADGLEIYNDLVARFPEYTVHHSSLGPVVAAHLGHGGMGIGYTCTKLKLMES